MKIELGSEYVVADECDCTSKAFENLAEEGFRRRAIEDGLVFTDIIYSQDGDIAMATAYVIGTDQVVAVPVEDIDGRPDL